MTRTISRRLRIARATVLAGILVLSGGAFALANIPDRAQTIHGCYTSNGALRVVDSELGQACKPNETSLDWSAAKQTAYHSPGAGHLTGSNSLVVADVTLPPGTYAITATVEIINTGPAKVQIACFLRADTGMLSLVHQTVGPSDGTNSEFATVAVTGVAEMSIGGVAKVDCQDQRNSGSPTSLNGLIVATSVSSEVRQIP